MNISLQKISGLGTIDPIWHWLGLVDSFDVDWMSIEIGKEKLLKAMVAVLKPSRAQLRILPSVSSWVDWSGKPTSLCVHPQLRRAEELDVLDIGVNDFLRFLWSENEVVLANLLLKLIEKRGLIVTPSFSDSLKFVLGNGSIRAVLMFIIANLDDLKEMYAKLNNCRTIFSSWKPSIYS